MALPASPGTSRTSKVKMMPRPTSEISKSGFGGKRNRVDLSDLVSKRALGRS